MLFRMLETNALNLFGDQRSVRPSQTMDRKGQLGQYFTPPGIADFMASMFDPPAAPVRLLDAGAGEGALCQAFVSRWRQHQPIRTEAYEIDDNVISSLANNLSAMEDSGVSGHIVGRDFLSTAATMIRLNRGPRYTHAILNPPYRKIATTSQERKFTASVGLETVNLYSAFLGLALELMQHKGQMVAIIPRSFCNGPYYRPFRSWMLERAALRQIHLFDSRRDAFSGDGVLQENVILHLVRGGEQSDVIISTSSDASFSDYSKQKRPFSDVLKPGDAEAFIHVPTGTEPQSCIVHSTLASMGLNVATGPVVAFRLRGHLHSHPIADAVPLIYPQHLKNNAVIWPIEGKKPNCISVNMATRRWLMPKGWYVVVKRFSSKEERRRIVATLCDPTKLPGDMLGFENKTNVLHQHRGPLPEELARGLTVYLNCTAVDHTFRQFSGHTQVNATDLRQMLFPTRSQLEMIGRRALASVTLSQQEIDECVEGVLHGAEQAEEQRSQAGRGTRNTC